MFKRHGLSGTMKQRVFDALLEQQHEKCAICGISLADLKIQCAKQPQYRRNGNIHYLLYIDHCHATGMIRGVLCVSCNLMLGEVENFGFKQKPATLRLVKNGKTIGEVPFTEEDFARIIEAAGSWLNKHKDAVLEYMQQERWLPRKDILFHLKQRSLT